jgi:hypothetical protein
MNFRERTLSVAMRRWFQNRVDQLNLPTGPVDTPAISEWLPTGGHASWHLDAGDFDTCAAGSSRKASSSTHPARSLWI